MEYRDYYKILGVDKKATEKEIKAAYRKLARQYHPDVNPGDKRSEERFKEINEAYQVLSDAGKRQKYDQVGADWYRWQQAGGAPGGFDWAQWTSSRGAGAGGRYGPVEDLGDLFGGGAFSDFFTNIFGGMRGGRTSRQSPYRFEQMRGGGSLPRQGQRYEQEVEISLGEAFHGTTRILEKGERRLEVKIPPGAKTGTKLRFAGEGAASGLGGQPGDLYLRIKVRADPRYERKGADLYTTVQVDLYDALLGGQVRVDTLSGPVNLDIQPETQNGRTLRLRGKGMPKLRQKEEHGDLYVKVDVRLPTHLTPQQRELLEEVRKAGG